MILIHSFFNFITSAVSSIFLNIGAFVILLVENNFQPIISKTLELSYFDATGHKTSSFDMGLVITLYELFL